jgi:hypothetical protein
MAVIRRRAVIALVGSGSVSLNNPCGGSRDYSFAPTIKWITTASVMFLGSLSTWTSMSSAASTFVRATAAASTSFEASGLMRTCTREIRLIAAGPHSVSVVNMPKGECDFHPALMRSPSNRHIKASGSDPTATESAYCCPANGFNAAMNAACCSSFRDRGASFVSSEMISPRWIAPIQPSVPNTSMVNRVSTASDLTSSVQPRCCFSFGNWSPSSIRRRARQLSPPHIPQKILTLLALAGQLGW